MIFYLSVLVGSIIGILLAPNELSFKLDES